MTKRPRKGASINPRAAVIYIHPGQLSASFAFSMMRMLLAEQASQGIAPAVIAQRCASGQLVDARNETVEYFLSTGLVWAMFVDSYMGFDCDSLSRLIDSATEGRIVGALCFGLKKQGQDDATTQAVTLRTFPTLYHWVERDGEVGWQVITDYPRDALVQVGATGAACFVVHRSVLQKIGDKFGTWFSPITHPVGPTTFSEDLSFFIRVAGVEAETFVDTSLKTSHDKGGVFLTETAWDEQQLVAQAKGSK